MSNKDKHTIDILKCGPENCIECKKHGYIGTIWMGYCQKCSLDYNFERGNGHFFGYEIEYCNCLPKKNHKPSLQKTNLEDVKANFFENSLKPYFQCTICNNIPDAGIYFNTITPYLDLRLFPQGDPKKLQTKQEFRNIVRKYLILYNYYNFYLQDNSINMEKYENIRENIKIKILKFLEKNITFKKIYIFLFKHFEIN